MVTFRQTCRRVTDPRAEDLGIHFLCRCPGPSWMDKGWAGPCGLPCLGCAAQQLRARPGSRGESMLASQNSVSCLSCRLWLQGDLTWDVHRRHRSHGTPPVDAALGCASRGRGSRACLPWTWLSWHASHGRGSRGVPPVDVALGVCLPWTWLSERASRGHGSWGVPPVDTALGACLPWTWLSWRASREHC